MLPDFQKGAIHLERRKQKEEPALLGNMEAEWAAQAACPLKAAVVTEGNLQKEMTCLKRQGGLTQASVKPVGQRGCLEVRL